MCFAYFCWVVTIANLQRADYMTYSKRWNKYYHQHVWHVMIHKFKLLGNRPTGILASTWVVYNLCHMHELDVAWKTAHSIIVKITSCHLLDNTTDWQSVNQQLNARYDMCNISHHFIRKYWIKPHSDVDKEQFPVCIRSQHMHHSYS